MLLYYYSPMPQCYAVSLLGSFLTVELPLRRIDVYPGNEHESDAFRAVNPLGTVPVLDTGEGVLTEWIAILTYLSAKYDRDGQWMPLADPSRIAQVQQALATARGLADSIGQARAGILFNSEIALMPLQATGRALLRQLDRQLWFGERSGQDWVIPGEHPTIGDVAIFVHAVLCEEAELELLDYPAVRRWSDRFKALDGFLAAGGVFGLPAPDGASPTYAA
jgi:glutathione S-transferase